MGTTRAWSTMVSKLLLPSAVSNSRQFRKTRWMQTRWKTTRAHFWRMMTLMHHRLSLVNTWKKAGIWFRGLVMVGMASSGSEPRMPWLRAQSKRMRIVVTKKHWSQSNCFKKEPTLSLAAMMLTRRSSKSSNWPLKKCLKASSRKILSSLRHLLLRKT